MLRKLLIMDGILIPDMNINESESHLIFQDKLSGT